MGQFSLIILNGTNGDKILCPVIFDDELYSLCQSETGGSKTFNSSLEWEQGSSEIFDEAFMGKSQSWQLVAFPMYPLVDSAYDEFLRLNFPGIYQKDPESVETSLLFNGETIPGGLIYYDPRGNLKQYYGIGVSGTKLDSVRYFPGTTTVSDTYNGYNDFIFVDYFVFPENNIVNNRFDFSNFSGTTYIGKIRLQGSISKKGGTYTATYVRDTIYCDFSQISFWNGKEPSEIITDPFDPGGSSGTGGGTGDFDNTSTPIEIPALPTISAASTGFISLFNPSLSQLNELASYLWSDLFEIDGWKKLFADPMDAILGLSILPVAIPSGGIREVKVGNIGTGISLTVAASQFVEVDCGSINVNEYWGAYLDYEPYTQAQIFLPYIGTRPISVDEIMGKTVRVVYHVDILTGACCCFVKCGDSVLYTYNGQCSIPIPVTSANYTSVVNGVISVAASVGSLVATGGASAPTAIPAIATSAVNQMKPSIEKSGSVSGSAGILNMQVPYLILTRPRQALPSKQNEFIGYPSLVTVQLAELSGYTEIQSIHLENIPATSQELDEIEQLLKGGVIF